MRYRPRKVNEREQPQLAPCTAKSGNPHTIPFAQRFTCTIDEAYEATGLGRTKLYELIGAGQLVTTTVGRRRLVLVRSLLALLDARLRRRDQLPLLSVLQALIVTMRPLSSRSVRPPAHHSYAFLPKFGGVDVGATDFIAS